MTQALELLALVQRLRREVSPAGRQRAGHRSAVSMSVPAAIRGAIDRSRGGADARSWRAGRFDELSLGCREGHGGLPKSHSLDGPMRRLSAGRSARAFVA